MCLWCWRWSGDVPTMCWRFWMMFCWCSGDVSPICWWCVADVLVTFRWCDILVIIWRSVGAIRYGKMNPRATKLKPKETRNRSKNNPKRIQEGSNREPKANQNGAKRLQKLHQGLPKGSLRTGIKFGIKTGADRDRIWYLFYQASAPQIWYLDFDHDWQPHNTTPPPTTTHHPISIN